MFKIYCPTCGFKWMKYIDSFIVLIKGKLVEVKEYKCACCELTNYIHSEAK